MFYFGLASHSQIEKMYLRFYPNTSETEAKKFASSIPDRTRTMAEIQKHLLRYSTNSEMALQHIDEFLASTDCRKEIDQKTLFFSDKNGNGGNNHQQKTTGNEFGNRSSE